LYESLLSREPAELVREVAVTSEINIETLVISEVAVVDGLGDGVCSSQVN
jgi:hypothetical protein